MNLRTQDAGPLRLGLFGYYGEDAGWSREQQMAFWVNAYNAFVLQTVVDNYPIRGRASNYPSNSVRQIPGVFDKTPRTVAGRTLTLDFGEPPRHQLVRDIQLAGRLQHVDGLGQVAQPWVSPGASQAVGQSGEERDPADSTVSHERSNTRMYDSGPLARLSVPRT